VNLWLRYRRVILLLAPLAFGWLLALFAILGFVYWEPIVGLLFTGLTLIWGLFWERRSIRDLSGPTRAVLLAFCSVSVFMLHPSALTAPAMIVMLAGVVVDPVYRRAVEPELTCYQLPGVRVSTGASGWGTFIDGGSICTIWAAVILCGGDVTYYPWGVFVIYFLCIVRGSLYLLWRRQQRLANSIMHQLEEHRPSYLLYYGGDRNGGYQLAMWMPFLERTGHRYAVLLREEAMLDTVLELTDAPVLYAVTPSSLEYALVETVGTIFYVNNDATNVQGTRFADLWHVHLGHGDSDKPSSFDSAKAMFDKVFLAGQAAIDRFTEHGVLVPAEKFEIVGRPQVAQIEQRSAEPVERPVVLYAPTWRGGMSDMAFSSLPIAVRLVRTLLDLGVKVLFRPHPLSLRDAESRIQIKAVDDLLGDGHLNSEATTKLNLFECMNLSTHMVTDISSVGSDYLFSRKPFAIHDMHPIGQSLDTAFPIARAAYMLDRDEDPRPQLELMLGPDPMAELRDEYRNYFLGDFPAEGYSDHFVAAVKQAIEYGVERRKGILAFRARL
jgi:hypothetical protein